MVKIRRARPSQFDEIVKLHKLVMPEDEIEIRAEGCQWWVALDGKKIVGYGGLEPSRTWQETGYMCLAGVHPDYRGKGLQKRLIRVRIKHAKKIGWKHLITYTYKNPPSANSLISCGFKVYDPIEPWGFKNNCTYWRLYL